MSFHSLRTALLAAVVLSGAGVARPACRLVSPDRSLVCEVTVADSLRIGLSTADGRVLLEPSTVGLDWTDGTSWGTHERQPRQRAASCDRTIASPFYKKSAVADRYNALTLTFKDFDLELRMYDDGLAYRFVNTRGRRGEIRRETALYRLPGTPTLWAPRVRDRKKRAHATREQLFWNDMQNHYTVAPVDSFAPGTLFFTPLLADNGREKLVFAEADVESYPGMYLAVSPSDNSLHGVSAPVPSATVPGGHNDLEMLVTGREDFIARVGGSRAFPWRAFIVSRDDRELPASDMVYRLASPCRIGDTAWIRPGKVAWDWWNDWGLYGVGFKAGVNNPTYKAYIDFAAATGIEYVILDEGWATKGKCDLLDVVPDIDVAGLVSYAADRNVGIILWAGYLALARDTERVAAHYARMGVKGFKIDFLNRDDQDMIDFMYRTAEICARHHLLVDYHGCAKPTGLQRTWPNVVNYEAVFGLEQMKWSKPGVDQITYDVTLPFIRSIAGPMDYTSGAMRNAVAGQYYPSRSKPMSQGTRCRQLAQFVVFDSPLAMLCDSPTEYMREPGCMRFLSAVPTVYERSEVLSGELGRHVAMARRAADGTWYVGAMTGHEPLSLPLSLDFLDAGTRYTVTSWADGPNCDKEGRDYVTDSRECTAADTLNINMAPGGGFAAIIKMTSTQ